MAEVTRRFYSVISQGTPQSSSVYQLPAAIHHGDRKLISDNEFFPVFLRKHGNKYVWHPFLSSDGFKHFHTFVEAQAYLKKHISNRLGASYGYIIALNAEIKFKK